MSDKHKTNRKKILIACGGTAGHIFPGIALAGELLNRHKDSIGISFITSENVLARRIFEESGYNFYTLPVKGARRRSVAGNIDFVVSLFAGAVKSIAIILRENPDCFVAFGSYVCGPPFMAASLLRIPTMIHEQNVAMGRANRLMRCFAKKIALSFPRNIDEEKKNVVVTGNPLGCFAAKKSAREEALFFLGMDRAKFTILVVGGSQGAQKINKIFFDVIAGIDELLLRRIQVIHIAGDNDYERVKGDYAKRKDISCKVYPFLRDMGMAYSAADMAVSRAGASSIFELCLHKVPAVLIPYPFAGSHQVDNAKYIAERNAAIMIEEDKLFPESLKGTILRLMEDSVLRDAMKRRLSKLSAPEAAEKLAHEVSVLAGLL